MTTIVEFIWRIVAWFVSRPAVANAIIRYSQKTPYTHLYGYMNRWWVFNPYTPIEHKRTFTWFPWSVRVHQILRSDRDRHLHDHPWNARTIILSGWYSELRESQLMPITRNVGDTARLNYGEFHRITSVSEDSVWTLFITGPYIGRWGFKVAGQKVDYKTYLGIEE